MWSFLSLSVFFSFLWDVGKKRINSCNNLRSIFSKYLISHNSYSSSCYRLMQGRGHGWMPFLILVCSFLLLVAVSELGFASGSSSFLPWGQSKWCGFPSQEQAGQSRQHPDRQAECGSVHNWAVLDPNVVSSPELAQEHRLSSWCQVNHALSWKTSWCFKPVLFTRMYLEFREGKLQDLLPWISAWYFFPKLWLNSEKAKGNSAIRYFPVLLLFELSLFLDSALLN